MSKTKRTLFPKSRVDHSVYGLGTIVEINERYTTIAFDEAGTKKFLTSVVELAASSTPRPTRSRRKKTAKESR